MARVLAVIPARGGSKSVPRKNIAEINGRPLIAWTILQALTSGVVDYVHLSTDDAEIAEAGRVHGASCDFFRPAEYSGDRIGTGPAVQSSVEALAERGQEFDLVVELQPTYLFRGSALVRECINRLAGRDDAQSIVTCERIQSTAHPDYVILEGGSGFAAFGKYRPDKFARQHLSAAYACKGVVLAARTSVFVRHGSFFGPHCLTHEVEDPLRLLDIDTTLDLDFARVAASRFPNYLK